MSDITTLMMAAAGQGAETDPNFNQTVLLLHGDGTNGAQNNTFLDSSTNNFTITRNGNTTQGTFSPFSGPDGYWSNFFDGTNDRLTIADNAALRPGTSAFTIEAWVYRAAAGAAHTIFAKGASTPTGFAFLITSSNTLRFTDTSTDITSTGTVAANTWVHVAAVREGTGSNQLKLYINGVQDGTGTSSTNFTQTEEARIGENRGATDDFNGYISNFRYVIGTALYTSGFTPSTSPLTTTSQGATSSQVELLTCQSNRFLDNSTNGFTISPVNNTSVQPFSPFAPSAAYSASVNGGSGYFDGTGDYLSVADNAAFDVGSGDFTIEGWYYLNSISSLAGANFFGKWIDPNRSYALLYVESTGVYRIAYSTTGSDQTVVDSAAIAPALNQWVHLAAVRNGTSLKVYLNGAEIISHNISTTTIYDASSSFMIGRLESNTDYDLDGYCSNFRFVKGTAVYTAAFTPPTAPLTAVSGTSLLCNFTNAGIFDNTGKNNLETSADAQIDTTTKKYGTGSMEFDGNGDWLQIPATVNFEVGTGNFTVEFWGYWSSIGNIAILFGWAGGAANKTFAYTYSDGRIAIGINAVNQIQSSAGEITTGSWIHIAYVKNGSTTTIYKNGTSIASDTTAVWYSSTGTESFYIGGSADLSDSAVYIDDFRITKGIARYTTTFTPPTAAFPNL